MPAADSVLATRLTEAAASVVGSTVDSEIREATKLEFGHFQSSLPLRLGRQLGRDPGEVAATLLARLDVADLCLPPAVAGRGFLNFTLRPEYLAATLTATDDRLGVPLTGNPQRIVIDYSQPNVAKEMHVGHLRSTVIGDALSRILEFTGHHVIRQNHIGDWGTQFGMLIEQFRTEKLDEDTVNTVDTVDLASLSALYRRARIHFDGDPEFAAAARRRVVALQSGDPATVATWRRLVSTSLTAFDETYRQLDVALTPADMMGESAYNDDLPRLVADLDRAGLLTTSVGAQCVFDPGFRGRDGAPQPLIVRKSDGGFGYAATDLAAIRHRVGTLRADRLVYVVDARQSHHFDQVFAVARQAGWLPERVSAEHVRFGSVQGENGQPLKSRGGDVVPLRALLHIAQQAAATLLADRGAGADADLARAVGIGAVKYADLSAGRARDYVFAVHRMVALDGNTGPYLQYAHARLCSLLRRAGEDCTTVGELTDPAEIHLAFVLTRFPAAVADTVSTLEPHRLCGYLHRLAVAFSSFYETCPVLRGEQRRSRIALCELTRRTLVMGLGLLGIQSPDRM